ncbi:MAG: acyltransferase [Chitinophagaceae bacterium]|nr:MAG: acyltransferase [Chitinophagaceae bacterium]
MIERNSTIDLLRFIASSAVVLFHLNEPFTHVDNAYRNFTKLGWLGVPIFFVISGYCIGLAAQYSKGILDFLTRRFFRIFPGYWFSLLVVLGVVGFHYFLFGHNSATVLPNGPREFAATICLLTHPATDIKTINWVYWSLTVEVFFYLAIGLTLLAPKKSRLICVVFISILPFIPKIETVPGLFFLSDWSSFGLGFALYHLGLQESNKSQAGFCFVINAAALLYRHGFDIYTITTFITFCLIWLSIAWRDLAVNRLTRLGDYAYGVYLLHVPLGVYLFGFIKFPVFQVNPFYNILFDAVVAVIVLLTARFMYCFIEKPAIVFGKKMSKRINLSLRLKPVQV